MPNSVAPFRASCGLTHGTAAAVGMMVSMVFVVAVPGAVRAGELRLELPTDAVIAGRVLFARAVVSGGDVASASASFGEQKIDLATDHDSLPILFALPLDAEPGASLAVHVLLATGEELHATAAVRIAPDTAPTRRPANAWNVAFDTEIDGEPESRELAALVAVGKAPRRWSKAFAAPARAPLLAGFGLRRGFAAHGVESPLHLGADYATRLRASVRAPAAGVVRAVRVWPLLGETLVLDHGLGAPMCASRLMALSSRYS